ncbi:MAG: hypothetical protein ACK4N5_01405 [Myxococcales bacterium]
MIRPYWNTWLTALVVVCMTAVAGFATAGKIDSLGREAMVPHTGYSPGNATNSTLDGTSRTVTVAAGSCVRISGTLALYYVVGSGSLTASASNGNALPADTVEKFCLTGQQTDIAFVAQSGTGGSFRHAVIARP